MNLALFDFDGTITFKDSFAPFMQSAVRPGRRRVGILALSPLIAAYKLGAVSASATRRAVATFGFKGRPENEVREAGVRFASEVLPATIRQNAAERIKWHKSRGDRVVVVSAALDVYLKPWCKAMNLEAICTELEARNGVLTGRYRRGDCVGPEKAKRVMEECDLRVFNTVYAYGDTTEDAEMLELAQHRFFRWRELSGPMPRERRGDHVDQVSQR